jgi:hypothetical protein
VSLPTRPPSKPPPPPLSHHNAVQFDYLGETTEGNLHFVQRLKRAGVVNLFGLESLEGIVTTDLESLQGAVQVSRVGSETGGNGGACGALQMHRRRA